MATSIDIVDSGELRFTRRTGYEAVRVARISGATGTGQQKLFNAINAQGMPNSGDAHPTISYIYVDEFRARALSDDVVEVEIIYRRPSIEFSETELTIEGGSAGTTYEVTEDIDGNLMTVSYDEDGDGEAEEQSAVVTVDGNDLVFRVSRIETSSPRSWAHLYIGHVNSVQWQGYEERQVRCNDIRWRSRDGGQTYEVTYEFQVKFEDPAGAGGQPWDSVYCYQLEDGSLPTFASDAEKEAGVRAFRARPETDFNALDINLSD